MARTKSTPEKFAVDTNDAEVAKDTNPEKIVSMPISIAQNVVNMIDLLASRGSFKGDELLGVGVLRQNVVVAIQAP